MDKKPYPSELQDRFIVRFPDGMRDHIAEAAKANNRSMNAEIVQALQIYYDVMEHDPSAFGMALAPGLGRRVVESEFHSAPKLPRGLLAVGNPIGEQVKEIIEETAKRAAEEVYRLALADALHDEVMKEALRDEQEIAGNQTPDEFPVQTEPTKASGTTVPSRPVRRLRLSSRSLRTDPSKK